MGRYLSWLANTVLFVLCCFLVANTANTVFASLLASDPAVTAPAARPAPVAQRSWADREIILARNLFNASLLVPTVPENAPEDDLEATKLPLDLLGTAAHADPRASWAAVEDLQDRKTRIVRPDDEIQGAVVLRIERGRIVLLENGQPRELALGDEDEGARPQVARSSRRPRRALANRAPGSSRDIANRVREIARNRFEVPREEIQDALQNPASIFSQVQFQPKYEDGEMLGLQVNSVRPGSIFEELGIGAGDLILEVNGIPIDSTEASAKVLTEFAKGQVTVGIEGPEGFREVEIQGSGEE